MNGRPAAGAEVPAGSPRPPDPDPQLPPDLTREAERFHRWLDSKLTELRQAELSYLEPVLPAMAAQWLESGRWARADPDD
jgi:hypothetical protein